MRFVFKTDYQQDIKLFKHPGYYPWYAALAILLLLAPLVLPTYYLSQMTLICIYAIIAVGMMILTGFTGQVSLGHAAFLAVGAYTQGWLYNKGVPSVVAMGAAVALSAAVGVIIGVPALRVKGIYLTIATFSFAFIVEEVLARWESVTGGNSGLKVEDFYFFGIDIAASEQRFYLLALAFLVGVMLLAINLMRSPMGRAFVAIRDSEVSAQSMGIHLARYKTYAFAISAALTGFAGALYMHKIKFVSPEQFGILASIEFLMMVVIGGLGSLHGAIYGAIFMIALPQAISIAKDYLPAYIGQQTGLQPTVFGLILIGFILFEPLGIYGRWMKIKAYFELFPFYRNAMFKRQKTYMKSDRLK